MLMTVVGVWEMWVGMYPWLMTVLVAMLVGWGYCWMLMRMMFIIMAMFMFMLQHFVDMFMPMLFR